MNCDNFKPSYLTEDLSVRTFKFNVQTSKGVRYIKFDTFINATVEYDESNLLHPKILRNYDIGEVILCYYPKNNTGDIVIELVPSDICFNTFKSTISPNFDDDYYYNYITLDRKEAFLKEQQQNYESWKHRIRKNKSNPVVAQIREADRAYKKCKGKPTPHEPYLPDEWFQQPPPPPDKPVKLLIVAKYNTTNNEITIKYVQNIPFWQVHSTIKTLGFSYNDPTSTYLIA